MGKSKPSMPPPDPMEIALGEIGMELYNEYETKYKPLNEKLLSKASVDRSEQAAGRSSVDAQIAASNQIGNSILRGATTGGFGGAGSISLVDAGATGAAVEGAAAAGYGAGKQNYVEKLGSAIGAVDQGTDATIAGMRNVAGIASRQSLDDYNNDQALKNIKSAGIAQTIGSFGSGYMMGAGEKRAQDMFDAQMAKVSAPQTGGYNWSFGSQAGGGTVMDSPYAPTGLRRPNRMLGA